MGVLEGWDIWMEVCGMHSHFHQLEKKGRNDGRGAEGVGGTRAHTADFPTRLEARFIL